ncbi:hypothetical protein ACKAV7_011930 [Fusarium commune]
MDDIVQLNQDYQILVCRLCQAAIRPGSSIELHFRRQHQLKGQVLKDIKDYYGTLELADPKLAAIPKDNTATHADILLLHEIILSATGERQGMEQERSDGPSDSNGPSDTADAADTTSRSAMDELIAASQARLEEEDAVRLRKGDLKEDIDRDSPWVKRPSGYGQGQQQAGQLGGKKTRKQPMSDYCLAGLDRALIWLNSISSVTPSGVPFGRKGKEESMSQYKSVGHRYLSFCWKAYCIRRKEAFERWAVRFTDEQWSLLHDVAEELERDRVPSSHDSRFFSGRERQAKDKDGDKDKDEDKDEDEDEDEDEDGDEDEYQDDDDSDDGEQGGEGLTSPLQDALDRAVFRFIVALIKTHVGGNVYTNSLLCFCAALGIKPRPMGYTEPHLYTGLLAAMVWWARLFFSEAVFENQPLDRDEVGVEAVLAFEEQHASWMCQSFASNPKNKWLEAGPAKVMRLMEASIWDATRVRWKRQRVKRWLRDLKLLREALLVLVHTWGGLPGRGPEITTLRHCDSWQLMRNIFILDRQVMIVTDRDKMKAIRDNGRKVARFVPDWIGRMIVAYIAWLLPTERVLRRECQLAEPRGEQLEYMWRDGCSSVWETDRLSRQLGRVMQAGTGVRLGVGRYRAIAIEMGRKIRGLVMKQLEGKMDDEDEDDNIEIDQITGEPVDCGGSWNIVWDLQSMHGTRIARQHYAVHIGFPGKLQPEMIATFKEISKLWHQFLEESSSAEEGKEAKAPKRKRDSQKTDEQQQQQQSIDSPTQITRSSKRRKTTQEEEPAQKRKETKEIREERKKKKLEDDMADGLRRLLGPKATWRSDKQAESMRSIMALKADQTAINVLPTGAGKSILFMLPAVMQDTGISIVVVPFVALMDDLVARATDMGVDCIRYRSSMNSGREGMPRAARLIVVSADVVSSAEFCGYVDGLSCTGLLQRIFVDECHTVIMDIGYRAKLGELVGLRRFGCPLVLLTATLPVVLEDWFRGEMLARSAIIVRDRTVKLNCRYEVQQVKPGRNAVEDHTVEVIKQLDQDMTGCQKGVIYCRSKSQCETIADEIGCGFHHSGMSEQDRHEARTTWAEGRNTSRWIAATTGLGTGIDIEGIVAVVHMEKPYGLVDFVQQIGRGGRRAGEVVRSVIIHDGRPQREDQHRSFVDDIN